MDSAPAVPASPPGDPAFWPGAEDVGTALVLAAPGRHEEAAGRPVAGQTGINLQGIVAHLHVMDKERFPSSDLRDYRIVNAFDGVLYDAKDGRSMPYRAEVERPANRARLAQALLGVTTIVAFSDVAAHAVRAAGREPDLTGPHPALRSLNNLYRGLLGDTSTKVAERHRLFAANLLSCGFG